MSSPYLERRRSSSSDPQERFPDLDASHSGGYLSEYDEDETGRNAFVRTSSTPRPNGVLRSERWQTRKDDHLAWGDSHLSIVGPRQHRLRSISDAFRNIRIRKASVSENANEIAEALKAPISLNILVGEAVTLEHAQIDIYLRFSALSGT